MVGPLVDSYFPLCSLKFEMLPTDQLFNKYFVTIESSVIYFSTSYFKLLHLTVFNKKITLLSVMYSFKIFKFSRFFSLGAT